MSLSAPKGLTEASVKELSTRMGEPSWLLELRMSAWKAFQEMPMPGRDDERWRRTDLRSIRLEELSPPLLPPETLPTAGALPRRLRTLAALDGRSAGVAIGTSSTRMYYVRAPEIASQGVILTGLSTAAREYEPLCRPYLEASYSRPAADKLAALRAALWSWGTFLYIPPHVAAQLPVHLVAHLAKPENGFFSRTLVALGEDSSITLVSGCHSARLAAATFTGSTTEVYLGPGSSLFHLRILDWDDRVFDISSQCNTLEANARLTGLTALLGGGTSVMHTENLLTQPHARSHMLGLAFGEGRQVFDAYTLQDHQAPRTESDLLYRVALRDRARSNHYGRVCIRPQAQKAAAFQTSRALLLGERAQSYTLPVLEIEADDVQCKHGAAIGPLEEDQLYYLMSRGLDREEATRMLVQAFFQPLLERIPLMRLRRQLQRHINRRIEE